VGQGRIEISFGELCETYGDSSISSILIRAKKQKLVEYENVGGHLLVEGQNDDIDITMDLKRYNAFLKGEAMNQQVPAKALAAPKPPKMPSPPPGLTGIIKRASANLLNMMGGSRRGDDSESEESYDKGSFARRKEIPRAQDSDEESSYAPVPTQVTKYPVKKAPPPSPKGPSLAEMAKRIPVKPKEESVSGWSDEESVIPRSKKTTPASKPVRMPAPVPVPKLKSKPTESQWDDDDEMDDEVSIPPPRKPKAKAKAAPPKKPIRMPVVEDDDDESIAQPSVRGKPTNAKPTLGYVAQNYVPPPVGASFIPMAKPAPVKKAPPPEPRKQAKKAPIYQEEDDDDESREDEPPPPPPASVGPSKAKKKPAVRMPIEDEDEYEDPVPPPRKAKAGNNNKKPAARPPVPDDDEDAYERRPAPKPKAKKGNRLSDNVIKVLNVAKAFAGGNSDMGKVKKTLACNNYEVDCEFNHVYDETKKEQMETDDWKQ